MIQESDTQNAIAEFLISEKYIAKYEFGGSTDIELQFKKGNVVTVIEKADNGWWKGICEGQVGWFPESYVRPAPKVETKTESNHTPITTATTEQQQQQVEQPRGMDEMMASGDCHVTFLYFFGTCLDYHTLIYMYILLHTCAHTHIHVCTQEMILRLQNTVLCLPTSQRRRVISDSARERRCWSTGLTRMGGGLDRLAVHRDGSQDPMLK